MRRYGLKNYRLDIVCEIAVLLFAAVLLGCMSAPFGAFAADLDGAPIYGLDPDYADIEAELVSFDLAGSAARPLCLAVGSKTVFLLQAKKRGWKTVDVVQAAGSALTGGFVDVQEGKKSSIRFFLSSVHRDGRVVTTFYISRKGVSRVEAQTAEKIYRKDNAALVSQKIGRTTPVVTVEMMQPGSLPRPLWPLPLPPGTGLFEFARFADIEAGESVRIEEDEDIGFWIKDRMAAKVALTVGRAPLDLPEGAQGVINRRYVPPLIFDVDGDRREDVIVAINNPDVSAGGFSVFRTEDHRSRVAVMEVVRRPAGPVFELKGATPVISGAIMAMAPIGDRVMVAVVDKNRNRTRLHWLRRGE